MYPKRTEFIASYLEITCVYYTLLDNRDLQSCQDGQGRDVAITSPAQSSLCALGHQAVSNLASGLDSIGIPLLGGGGVQTNYLLWVQIAEQCFLAQHLECTALNYDKLGFKYPSPEHNLEAFLQNHKAKKLLISEPEQSTSAPYVGDNEVLGTAHTEGTFEC